MISRALRNFVIVVGVIFAPAPAAADAIVPGGLAAVDGNSNNIYPFNSGDIRYQQVYAASEFGPDALYIDAVLFRPDTFFGQPFSSLYSSVQVNLSTTQNGPDGLSSTFAVNVGPDDTIVRSGPLSLTSSDTAGPGNTRAFDIYIPFTTSFLYDPALGNLLLDLRIGANSGATILDAHVVSGDSVSRLYGFGQSTATGFNDTAGLVTKFETTAISAVPDPASSLGLLVMGIGSLFAARTRFKGD